MSFNGNVLKATAVEDSSVGTIVQVVSLVQALWPQVETIGVLHRELANPKQSRFGSRLVTKLRLYLIPDLRKLAVGSQLVSGNHREHFLVCHSQAEVSSTTILEAKHVLAHFLPSTGLHPDLPRVEGREVELLSSNPIHLFAEDLLDLEQSDSGQRELGVDTSPKLTDKSGT
jgi:hypothetical protein